MPASTALEALIAELLGDVGVLHDQVKALRLMLPSAAADACRRLEDQTSRMLAAADEMRAAIDESRRQAEAKLGAAAAKTTEAAKRDIGRAAAVAAVLAARMAIGAEVGAMVSSITKAGTALAAEAYQARVMLVRPTPLWETWTYVIGIFVGGVLVGAIGIALAVRTNSLPDLGPDKACVQPAQQSGRH
jgi:hypothetical protein